MKQLKIMAALMACLFTAIGITAAERTILLGPKTIGPGWKDNIVIQPEQFAVTGVGDIITVYVDNVKGGAQGAFQDPADWKGVAPEYSYFGISGPFRMKVTQDILDRIKQRGLAIGGHDYRILRVTHIPAAEMVEKVVYRGPSVLMKDDWSASAAIQKSCFDGVKVGDVLHFKVSRVEEGAAAKIMDFTDTTVRLAGRMMSKRVMGKVSFCDLQDRDGRIQLYARQDEMDEAVYKKFKKFDIGDIVGVDGEVFRTQRGEMSVRARNITLLSKALLPLPEKFHGLQDRELRYRQRYVDLIVNPEVKRNFIIRSRFIKHVRDFLDGRGYMEVETPVLNTISGGATARPFITHHNTLDIDMYMRIATELPLKRLIVGGLDRVYEIGRIFRNEGMDPKHNPEFTTVELYQAYTDFNGMMDLFEDLLSSAAQKILGTYQLEWQGEQIDLTPGWPRLTMHEAVKQYTGIDFMAISSDEEAVAAAKAIGVELPETADPTWGNALYETFDQKVEEKLVQPTFITMHPVDVSPLAKRSPRDPRLTERFELFICRSEMGNAFSELNDPIDQKQRFQKQVELRAKGDSEAGMMDEDYINALEYGMPPTGGLGIGIDRCAMLLTGSDSIRDVILFPTMKPLDN